MDFTLPNGLQISQINRAETEFLVHEIFERLVYPLPSFEGIAEPVILDVGANIGVFACYALEHCPRARVLCFEPVPPVADVLETNVAGRASVERCALGAIAGRTEITFYPGYSIMSRMNADVESDHGLLNSCVRHDLQSKMKRPRQLGAHHVATMVEEMLDAPTTFDCEVKTLPEVLRAHGIERVDYLKMDVEGCEVAILQSLPAETWARIGSLALEVHEYSSEDASLTTIENLLGEHGFEVKKGDITGVEHPRTIMVFGFRPA